MKKRVPFRSGTNSAHFFSIGEQSLSHGALRSGVTLASHSKGRHGLSRSARHEQTDILN